MSERFRDDDDYFSEPNYDKLSDEQLDELYYYGEIRTPSARKKAAHKATMKKSTPRLFSSDEDNWLDVDLDGDEDLYDDD